MTDEFKIKRKSTPEVNLIDSKIYKKQDESTNQNEDKNKFVQRLKMPEIDMDEIFQKMIEDATNDVSIYRILVSILSIYRNELVS